MREFVGIQAWSYGWARCKPLMWGPWRKPLHIFAILKLHGFCLSLILKCPQGRFWYNANILKVSIICRSCCTKETNSTWTRNNILRSSSVGKNVFTEGVFTAKLQKTIWHFSKGNFQKIAFKGPAGDGFLLPLNGGRLVLG